MTMEAVMHDGRILVFPDGTDPAVIQATVKRILAEDRAKAEAEGTTTPVPGGKLGATVVPVETPQAIGDAIDEVLLKIPGAPTFLEAVAGFNRSVLGGIDFLGPDLINQLLELGGSEKRVPTLSQLTVPKGTFADKGLGTDIAASIGELVPAGVAVGSLLRKGAQSLPALTEASESAIKGILRQMGQTTVATDVGFSALAAVGGEVGRSLGGRSSGEELALVGSILAPLGAGPVVGIAGALKKVLSGGPKELSTLTTSLAQFSDDGAASMLSEAMVREGISVDDAAKALASLGPEGLPADIGINFARLLRAASNKIPTIEGKAARVFGKRHNGQASRLSSALDTAAGVPGLTVDDEIARLNIVMKPIVKAAYDAAGKKPIRLSKRLRTLLTGKNSVGRARKKATLRLADKRAAGEVITNIDVIDATKRELGDQIGVALKAGKKNTVGDLTKLKNIMVREADKSIPEYKAARGLFAGKVQLEQAADQGTNFFKLKSRDVVEFISSMGESEKRMFRLGAKQAVLDRIDTMQVSADAVKKLFGTQGDIPKLQALFPTKAQFDAFSDTLKREANFTLTRRAAQANSTTTQQLSDIETAEQAFDATRALMGDPVAAVGTFGRIFRNLNSQKSSRAFTESLEQAGDILLTTGMKPETLQRILMRGDAPKIKEALEKVMPRALGVIAPTAQTLAAKALVPAPEELRGQ